MTGLARDPVTAAEMPQYWFEENSK